MSTIPKGNPYMAGKCVDDSSFVGRIDVFQKVENILLDSQRNAIILYGEQRIGKTSVLLKLKTKLSKKGTYIPIYFDLHQQAQKHLKDILWELAYDIMEETLGGTPDLGDNPENTFRKNWLPDFLNNLPREKMLVLLFDEFETLVEFKYGQLNIALCHYLHDLLNIFPQRLNFVFAIGDKGDDPIHIAPSLLKGIPLKCVDRFNRNDTIKLIRFSETNNTLNWIDDAIEKVWQVTGGHPYLTQRLCYQIWDDIYDKNPNKLPTVSLRNVETAIKQVGW
jgi:hypothetical protein